MENNKETIWITIPEEVTPPKRLPMDDPHDDYDTVKNRVFWGVGFVALIIFSSMLFAPQQFVGLMQGQLFDGGFQVVPDYDAQQDQGDLFGGEELDSTEITLDEEVVVGESESDSVVSAEDDAVTIQIEPLEPTEPLEEDANTQISDEIEEVSEGALDDVLNNIEGVTDAGEIDKVEVVDEISKETTESDINIMAVELDELKKMQEENQALIVQLTDLLQAKDEEGLHGSATQVSPSLLPIEQTTQFGQPQVQPAVAYRYNTHIVTVDPYDVLQSRQSVQVAQTGQLYQANLQYNDVKAYANSNYNPVLAGVQGQPDTGPAESIIIAMFLASVGILVWGSIRAVRV